MASLFERLIGQNLPESPPPAPDETKIAFHAYCGALNELRRGKITGGEIATMFDLNASQISDSIALKNLIVASVNRTEFMRVLKDWLYLGETETDARYLVQANFISRLQEEVTDQGGTLP